MEHNPKIKAFIAARCANYDTDGLCHLETSESGLRLCPIFHNIGKKCKYAEKAVIPGDAHIEALYYAGKKEAVKNADTCGDCQQPYFKKSNSQKRCKSCADRRRKNKRIIYDADYRSTRTNTSK